MELAIMGGTSLQGADFFGDARRRALRVGGRTVVVFVRDGAVFLPRHGPDGRVAPHLVDHAAHMRALAQLGVRRILAVNSVGSLKRSIRPEHYVVPDDYIGLWTPFTVFRGRSKHVTPALDEPLRRAILAQLRRMDLPYRNRGVYVQTPGPRLETRAEIRLLAQFADVVGMTMASEATAACELGIAYASVCVVDNYANGIARTPLTVAQITASARRKMPVVIRLLQVLIEECA